MAIVSCPECSKKLKVAEASIGKKIKCSCGQVFVAEAAMAVATAAPVAEGSADKVVVACTECSAKLKVAVPSLGKKMKCPKCAAVFVAALDKPPTAEPEIEVVEEPVFKSNGKGTTTDDDLLALAQSEEKDEDAPVRRVGKHADAVFAGAEEDESLRGKRKAVPDDSDEDDKIPWKKGKAKHADPDEDDEPTPKGKKGALAGKGNADQKPVYPSRMPLNLLVVLMMFVFIAVFAAFFFSKEVGDVIGVKDGFHADYFGLHNPKFVLKGQNKPDPNENKGDEKEELNNIDVSILRGTWIVESAEKNGAALDVANMQKFTFADGTLTGPDFGSGKFGLDATQKPKTIDLTDIKGAPPVLGIYKIEDKKLHLCMSADKVRPKEFSSTKATLYVLKKEKKDRKDRPKKGGGVGIKDKKNDQEDKNARNDGDATETFGVRNIRTRLDFYFHRPASGSSIEWPTASSSGHNSPGIGACASSNVCGKRSGFETPTIVDVMRGSLIENCSAAAASGTLLRLHISSILRTRSTVAASAFRYA